MIHGAGKIYNVGAPATNRYQITVHMPDDVEDDGGTHDFARY